MNQSELEYSTRNEKYTRGNQYRQSTRLDKQPGRQNSGNDPIRTAKRKKDF